MKSDSSIPLCRLQRHTSLLCMAIALVTLCIYWQVGSHGFHLYDDGDYVANNPAVLGGISGDGIRWAFTRFHSGNWHPLTWLSHMLDTELFGTKPAGHHLVNLTLHVVNAILAFLLLRRMTSRALPSFLVALLFAVHPLRVESVAWIAERKDLLSGLFFCSTLLAWDGYVKQRSVPAYCLALALFALGLMAKPMLVTLPLILLLLDWWPYARLDCRSGLLKLAGEKLPFFVLTLFSSLVTYLAQDSSGAVTSFARSPLALRLANSAVSYVSYLKKTAWPTDLSIFYPFPSAIPWWQSAASSAVLATITMICYRLRHRKPYLLAGWLWFVIMLVPVIGIIQVGAQAMADRYSYLPQIGLFVAVVWGGAEWGKSRARQVMLAACAAAVVALLSVAAWRQASYWQSNIVLFSRALAITPNTPLAKANLVKAYNAEAMNRKERWDLDGALELLRLAAPMSTGTIAATVHNNIGLILAMKGDDGGAAREYRLAMEHEPAYADPYLNMGLLSYEGGRFGEAAYFFRETLRLDPGNKTAGMYLKQSARE